MFAKYWDKVEDPREISGVSRFLSGGIGGLTSQLSMCPVSDNLITVLSAYLGIYPIETLKTQMMSSAGERRSLRDAARRVWGLGGMRAYYRGLGVRLHNLRSFRLS